MKNLIVYIIIGVTLLTGAVVAIVTQPTLDERLGRFNLTQDELAYKFAVASMRYPGGQSDYFVIDVEGDEHKVDYATWIKLPLPVLTDSLLR